MTMKFNYNILLKQIERELHHQLHRSTEEINYTKTWMWNNNTFRQMLNKVITVENTSMELDHKFWTEHANLYTPK